MNHPKSKEWAAHVVSNKDLGAKYGLISLRLPKAFPRVKAGSFCMLSTGGSREVLLRRPMAFFDVQKNSTFTSVQILYRVVGRGTRLLAGVEKDSELSLLGPIGNCFSKPKTKEHYLVAAGGIGISPFLLWGRQLSEAQHKRVRVLFGFPTEDHTSLVKLYKRVGLKPICAVEKAKTSFQGTVLDLLKKEFESAPAQRILTCGPEAMMEAVKDFCRVKGIPCEVSLEAKMACGMGVCLSCVTSCQAKNGGPQALVCQDGPIFTFPS